MVGDGGNGNSYKQTGRKSLYDCGEHGGTGENCGNVNIYDSLKVLAYGGKGGSGGNSLGSNSGGGGGGYPASGIGGGGAGGGRWRPYERSWWVYWWK